MTRDEWEDVLYAAVPDEVIQDQLNDYALSLEGEVAELRKLVRDIYASAEFWIDHFGEGQKLRNRMRELGIEVNG